jgi:hypothetical protein
MDGMTDIKLIAGTEYVFLNAPDSRYLISGNLSDNILEFLELPLTTAVSP